MPHGKQNLSPALHLHLLQPPSRENQALSLSKSILASAAGARFELWCSWGGFAKIDLQSTVVDIIYDRLFYILCYIKLHYDIRYTILYYVILYFICAP